MERRSKRSISGLSRSISGTRISFLFEHAMEKFGARDADTTSPCSRNIKQRRHLSHTRSEPVINSRKADW